MPLTVTDTCRKSVALFCLFLCTRQGKRDVFGLDRLSLKSERYLRKEMLTGHLEMQVLESQRDFRTKLDNRDNN